MEIQPLVFMVSAKRKIWPESGSKVRVVRGKIHNYPLEDMNNHTDMMDILASKDILPQPIDCQP